MEAERGIETATEVPGLPAGLRVALIHDWLTGYRGGEKVLEVLCELFPAADLYTLIHVEGSSHPTIENRKIFASWMNRLPGVASRYRMLLPFFPNWADGLELSGYDLIVSSSHCVAKGARAGDDAVHVCYCHTPMRYVWDRFDDYFGDVTGPKRALIDWQAARLRRWDKESAERVDQYLANSRFVAGRIERFYGIDTGRIEVVAPPVDLGAFPGDQGGGSRQDRYLVVSALVPYKRIDVAVEACARSGRRLTVAGQGPEMERLAEIVERFGAWDRIELRGFVADEELPALMATHRALLFPGVEDFGITPLEATAMGLPVLALGEGGALDTVVDGLNGRLYHERGVEGLIGALDRFEGEGQQWSEESMRSHAESFSRRRFADELKASLSRAYQRGPVREH